MLAWLFNSIKLVLAILLSLALLSAQILHAKSNPRAHSTTLRSPGATIAKQARARVQKPPTSKPKRTAPLSVANRALASSITPRTKARIKIDVVKAPLIRVVQGILNPTRLNYILDVPKDQFVTASYSDVHWKKGLKRILDSKDLAMVQIQDTVVVTKPRQIRKRFDADWLKILNMPRMGASPRIAINAYHQELTKVLYRLFEKTKTSYIIDPEIQGSVFCRVENEDLQTIVAILSLLYGADCVFLDKTAVIANKRKVQKNFNHDFYQWYLKKIEYLPAQKISLQFPKAPLKDLLRTISQAVKKDLLIDGVPDKHIMVHFNATPWDLALELLVRATDLMMYQDENTLIIGPNSITRHRYLESLQKMKLLKSIPLFLFLLILTHPVGADHHGQTNYPTNKEEIRSDQVSLHQTTMTHLREKNYKAAIPLLFESAKQGHTHAQFYLAMLYELGRGIKRDWQRARVLYHKASQKGHIKAKIRLQALKARINKDSDVQEISDLDLFKTPPFKVLAYKPGRHSYICPDGQIIAIAQNMKWSKIPKACNQKQLKLLGRGNRPMEYYLYLNPTKFPLINHCDTLTYYQAPGGEWPDHNACASRYLHTALRLYRNPPSLKLLRMVPDLIKKEIPFRNELATQIHANIQNQLSNTPQKLDRHLLPYQIARLFQTRYSHQLLARKWFLEAALIGHGPSLYNLAIDYLQHAKVKAASSESSMPSSSVRTITFAKTRDKNFYHAYLLNGLAEKAGYYYPDKIYPSLKLGLQKAKPPYTLRRARAQIKLGWFIHQDPDLKRLSTSERLYSLALAHLHFKKAAVKSAEKPIQRLAEELSYVDPSQFVQRAANRMYTPARLTLALGLLQRGPLGGHAPKETRRGLELLKDLAFSGHPRAMFELALFLESNGDPASARDWLSESASRDFGPAIFNLAVQDFDQDKRPLKELLKSFQKARKLGVIQSVEYIDTIQSKL